MNRCLTTDKRLTPYWTLSLVGLEEENNLCHWGTQLIDWFTRTVPFIQWGWVCRRSVSYPNYVWPGYEAKKVNAYYIALFLGPAQLSVAVWKSGESLVYFLTWAWRNQEMAKICRTNILLSLSIIMTDFHFLILHKHLCGWSPPPFPQT